ncbi:MAG TPA: hypothetical protein VGJ28_10590, partial [Micromonosporaceae bacterium]
MDSVVFPVATGGSRSTSALGRAVVADALRGVDPIGARAVVGETDWRHNYVGHFRRLIEAGLESRDGAVTIATDGLASLHKRMRYIGADGETALSEAFTGARTDLGWETLEGRGDVEHHVSLPLRGE